MGDEAVSKKLAAWSHAVPNHLKSSDTELLSIAGGQHSRLLILCGERFRESRVLRSGEFSARMIQVAGESRVAIVTCVVGEHHWMLAKDSMAVKVGERAFVFALPGVIYGLAVPWSCSGRVMQKLENIFRCNSAYHDLATNDDGSDPSILQSESEIWRLAYEKLENLATRSSTKIAATAPLFMRPMTLFGGRGATYDIAAAKIQRAVRMSAAVKLAYGALMSGALVPHEHLHVPYTSAPSSVLPSVGALSDLLNAIESSGRVVTVTPPLGRAQGFWWLRIEGVEMLLEVVRAYGVEARKKPRMNAALTS